MSSSNTPYADKIKTPPALLPVFPLAGVLLLPGGTLPLNIFEPRYLEMVDDAMSTKERMIGIIQPQTICSNSPHNDTRKPPLLDVGCAGRITDFSETKDGRYLITLTGLWRFGVKKEKKTNTAYRQITADWTRFDHDFKDYDRRHIDREQLETLLEDYFDNEGLRADWEIIKKTTDDHLITCLSMICPFSATEKQALLEAPCANERAEMFLTILTMAVKGHVNPSSRH